MSSSMPPWAWWIKSWLWFFTVGAIAAKMPVTMAKKPSRVVAAASAPGKRSFVRIHAVTG